MDWQPIETAPKDGVPVLTYTGDMYETEAYVVMWWSGGVWRCLFDKGPFCPEHWMPLPEPPSDR